MLNRPRRARMLVLLVLSVLLLALLTVGRQAAPKPFSIPEPAAYAVILPYYEVRMTAYTSRVEETDDTPFETATMTRTRPGVVAVSRDLLQGALPYTTRVRIYPKGGAGCGADRSGWEELLDVPHFIVEDTMHPRKRQQVDVWFPDLEAALTWGVCHGYVIPVGEEGLHPTRRALPARAE